MVTFCTDPKTHGRIVRRMAGETASYQDVVPGFGLRRLCAEARSTAQLAAKIHAVERTDG